MNQAFRTFNILGVGRLPRGAALFIEVGCGWGPAFLFRVGRAPCGTAEEGEGQRTVAKGIPSVQAELESRVEALGLELVDAEWAGSTKRPILRIRIDRPGAAVGTGVTVDDCAVVSRGLETWLDEHPDVPERYVLEVSSPGVERPLVRPGDWVRFQGEDVVVVGRKAFGSMGARIEGALDSVEEVEGEWVCAVRLASGEEIRFSLDVVKRAHLLYRWE